MKKNRKGESAKDRFIQAREQLCNPTDKWIGSEIVSSYYSKCANEALTTSFGGILRDGYASTPKVLFFI